MITYYSTKPKKRCRAHRLAWIYVYGVEPDGEIDHINGIRSDNRICNFRIVDDKQNARNRRKQWNRHSAPTLRINSTVSLAENINDGLGERYRRIYS
ncbi:HNH endonuclease signature motif containing protein [Symbiopectobacterium sp.]|uniref:HNH endonuclease signature motif containing protein n=1 Tax=Symbiopectobacterium sp. TaxID=2952789 RepID=UPI003F3DBF4E